MKLNVRFIMGAFFALTIIVSSCNTFKDEITPDNYSEVAKNINANWQLSAVSRNGVDITDMMDFTRFHIVLNEDNTYKIENCSDFCKSVVLPLLTTSDSHFSMSLDDLRKRLYIWLYKSGENTVLICDSKRDIEQINELFPQGLPKNCSYKVLGFFERLKM